MRSALILVFLLGAWGCSGNEPSPPKSYAKDGAITDGAVTGRGNADGAAAADGATDAIVTVVDAGTKKPDAGGFPDGFLEPLDSGPDPDSGPATDSGATSLGPVGKLYAHTATGLYELDLGKKAFIDVGTFSFNKNPGKITDIALNRFGVLYAISDTHLFKCVVTTAKCVWLAKLPAPFNGMTFVAEDVVMQGEEALIGISVKGAWTHIDISGGTVKLKTLGTYGGGWLSSGDAFSVNGIGTFATLKGKGSTDSLARIDPKTGKIIKVIGEIGAVGLFGLAWWNDVFYAFSKSGKVYSVDVKTGKGQEVKGLQIPKNVSWWGAGVSTRANGG